MGILCWSTVLVVGGHRSGYTLWEYSASGWRAQEWTNYVRVPC